MMLLHDSVHDLTSEVNVPDARADFLRCNTDGDFAKWARTWGRPAMDALEGGGFDDELGAANEEIRDLEDRVGELEGALSTIAGLCDEAAEELESAEPDLDALRALNDKILKAADE